MKIILTFIIISLFFTCKSETINNKDISNSKSVEILNTQNTFLRGKKIKALNHIVGDGISLPKKVLFFYNSFDCKDCIDVGFDLAKKIDSIFNNQKIIIISTQLSVKRFESEKFEFVFEDKNSLLLKELNYIKTPVLLYLNQHEEIYKSLFIKYNRDSENLKRQIDFLNFIINDK